MRVFLFAVCIQKMELSFQPLNFLKANDKQTKITGGATTEAGEPFGEDSCYGGRLGNGQTTYPVTAPASGGSGEMPP